MNNFVRTMRGAFLVCCLATAMPALAQDAAEVDDFDVPDAPAAAAQGSAAQEAAPPIAPGPAVNPAPADPALLPVFKEFGELPGLTALMDDFMVQLLADPRMRPFFENTDQKKVKQHLVEQFCVILGGPCSYSGRDMKETHAGLEINRANFNALVEDLQVSMNKRGIPFRAQNKLLAKLAPMHREIETK